MATPSASTPAAERSPLLVVCVRPRDAAKDWGCSTEQVHAGLATGGGGDDEIRLRLRDAARALIPEDQRRGYGRFRLVGEYAAPGEEGAVRIYGFKRGPGRPNPHELPPVPLQGTARPFTEPLLYGPLLAVRVAAAPGDSEGDGDGDDGPAPPPLLRSLTVADYALFRERAFGEESLGEEDSSRSTDGSDNGSSLDDFIASDNSFD